MTAARTAGAAAVCKENQENHNSSILPITNCKRLPAKKKIAVNCYQILYRNATIDILPADDILRTQNERERLSGEVTGKSATKTFKNRVATPKFHVTKWKW